jgi:hypothetical protein
MRILCSLVLGISAACTPYGYIATVLSAIALPLDYLQQIPPSFHPLMFLLERGLQLPRQPTAPYRCVQVLFFFILLLDLLSDDMTASVDADVPLHSDILAVCVVDKLQCPLGPVDHKGMLA